MPRRIANLPASLVHAFDNWLAYTYEDNAPFTIRVFVTRVAAAFRRALPELVLTDGTPASKAVRNYNALPPTWVENACVPPPEPPPGTMAKPQLRLPTDDPKQWLRARLCPYWKTAEDALAHKDCDALLWSIFHYDFERRSDGAYERAQRGLLPMAPILAVMVEDGESSTPDMSEPTTMVGWWTTLLLCDSLVRTCCPEYKLNARFTQPGLPYWMIAAMRAGDPAAFREHFPLPPRPDDDDLVFRARVVHALRGLVFERDWLDSEADARAVEPMVHDDVKRSPPRK